MSTNISHKATVIIVPENDKSNAVRVRLNDSHADCSGCSIVAMCGRLSDSAMLTAECPRNLSVTIGSNVIVEASSTLHQRAVTLLLILPTIVMLVVATLITILGMAESVVACGAILALFATVGAVYFAERSRTRLRWQVTEVIE